MPASGSLVFSDGSSSAISAVTIDNAAYLSVNSTFTITLVAATYLGTDGVFSGFEIFCEYHKFPRIYLSLLSCEFQMWKYTHNLRDDKCTYLLLFCSSSSHNL